MVRSDAPSTSVPIIRSACDCLRIAAPITRALTASCFAASTNSRSGDERCALDPLTDPGRGLRAASWSRAPAAASRGLGAPAA
jgi:hypothetical protein